VEAFSQALENNADGIDTFLSSVSDLSETFRAFPASWRRRSRPARN
jgi:hypothetical protein